MVALEGEPLEERVEAHELNAGLPEDLVAWHPGKSLFHDLLGMRIAVMPRIAEQHVATTKQGKIDAPGIDAETIELAVLGAGEAQRILHFVKQAQDIPIDAVGQSDAAVGEAVHDI